MTHELLALADGLVAALYQKRFLTPLEAALISDSHVETVRDALRSGALHGSQRTKGGTWRVRPACVDAWIDGVRCEHQVAEVKPLDEWRWRTAGAGR